MKVGFYAGSFDPFTNGHLFVVKQAAKLFDKLIIAIGIHPQKTRRFDKELMKQAIEQVLISNHIDNAIVICYDGLSVDVAAEYNTDFFVRGLRNGMDYDYEENLASINEELAGIDTIYFRAGSLGYVSSSMVMELLRNGKDVSKYLPQEVLRLTKE